MRNWRILTETGPIHLAYGVSSSMRVMSNLEIKKSRMFTHRMLEYTWAKWNRATVGLVMRDAFASIMTEFDKYFIKIFYPESRFYSELVWGCSPNLKFSSKLVSRYPKFILQSGNPIKDLMSLIMDHPKEWFCDTSTDPIKSGVSHIFERVRVKNEFKVIRGLDSMSKWLYYYILFYQSWRIRYDIKLLAQVEDKPDFMLHRDPFRPWAKVRSSGPVTSCYESGMSGKIP
jgi:hypothetical protein